MADESLFTTFIDIQSKGLDVAAKGLDSLKSKGEALEGAFKSLGAVGLKLFAGLSAVIGLTAKAAADDEEATQKLKSALRANGEEVDNNAARLSDLAKSLQDVTNISKDTIKEQMAFASNLGVTSDKMEDVIKVGVGLGAAFFGGDSSAGIEAFAKALNGNTRELDRLIPGLKQTANLQDKINLLTAAGARGLNEAVDNTKTFSGTIANLKNHFDDAAEAIGNAFLPILQKAAEIVTAITDAIDNLTDAQKDNIVHWAKIAAVVAVGAIAFGVLGEVIGTTVAVIGAVGAVVAAGATVFGLLASAAITAGSAIFSIGGALVALVTSPITLVIAAIGALVAALAVAMGDGDTFTERMGSGFGKMYGAIKGWVGSIVGELKTFWSYLTDIWKYFESVTNDIGGEIAKLVIKGEALATGKYFTKGGREEVQKELDEVDNQTRLKQDEITRRAQNGQHVDGLGDSPVIKAVNDGLVQPALAGLETIKAKTPAAFANIQDEIKALEDKGKALTAGGGLGGLLGGAMSKAGDYLSGTFDKVADELAKKLGLDKDGKRKDVKPPKAVAANATALNQKPIFTSLEEEFKKNMAMQLLGGDTTLSDPKTVIAKDHLTTAKDQLLEAKKTNKALGKLNTGFAR